MCPMVVSPAYSLAYSLAHSPALSPVYFLVSSLAYVLSKKNSRTSLSGRSAYFIILSQAVSSPFLTNLWLSLIHIYGQVLVLIKL